jgi:hypothetical protein
MRPNARKSQHLVQPEPEGSWLATAVEARTVEGGVLHFDHEQRALSNAAEAVMNPSGSCTQRAANGQSRGDSTERAPEMARPVLLQCSDCEGLLHELSNVVTGILMNAQVLGWKLPPYSHLKRSVHEVERNAQRGGELLKQLMRRVVCPGRRDVPGEELGTARRWGSGGLPANRIGATVPDLTGDCDPRTRRRFPKKG